MVTETHQHKGDVRRRHDQEQRSGGPAERLDEPDKHVPYEWTGQKSAASSANWRETPGRFDDRLDLAGGRLPHQLHVFQDHTLSPQGAGSAGPPLRYSYFFGATDPASGRSLASQIEEIKKIGLFTGASAVGVKLA
jgi:hypothetical protein